MLVTYTVNRTRLRLKRLLSNPANQRRKYANYSYLLSTVAKMMTSERYINIFVC